MPCNPILSRRVSYAICAILFLQCTLLFCQQTIGGRQILKGNWRNHQIEYVDGQILLKLNRATTRDSALSVLSRFQANLIDDFDVLQWGRIELPEGQDIFPVMNALQNEPAIEAVEPNGIMYPTFNDPYYIDGHQWYLRNTGQSPPGGNSGADIHFAQASNITWGTSNIIIGILDSGIPLVNGSLSHPDLNDANRFILGPNYIDGQTVRDGNGHGTHVTGIVAAQPNNNVGIVGIASGSTVMVIKVFSDYPGTGTYSAFHSGVIYAVDHGAKLMNYSGETGVDSSLSMEDAVNYAYSFGVLLCAAAGNDGNAPAGGSTVNYPAKFSTTGTISGHTNGYSNVICVSATDP